MNAKLLLVEDSPEYHILVKSALGQEFEVTTAETANEALSCLRETRFDAAVIDLRLPDRDGLSLCQEIRNQAGFATLPLIILTGKREMEDKLQGFRIGADDYVIKPFDPLEFKTRVLSKVRRFREMKSLGNELKVGDVTLSFSAMAALHRTEDDVERDLELTPAEFRLFAILGRNRGTVMTRVQLLDALGRGSDEIRDRTVDRHLSSLRRKLSSTQVLLESVYSEGYLLSLKQSTVSLQ